MTTPIVDNESTQCVVFDQTPGSEQKKINIVVRPSYTVSRIINVVKLQFSYKKFELLLQPHGDKDLIYLNEVPTLLLYEMAGFERNLKNHLVLLPDGTWDGNVKRRYELPIKPMSLTINSNATMLPMTSARSSMTTTTTTAKMATSGTKTVKNSTAALTTATTTTTTATAMATAATMTTATTTTAAKKSTSKMTVPKKKNKTNIESKEAINNNVNSVSEKSVISNSNSNSNSSSSSSNNNDNNSNNSNSKSNNSMSNNNSSNMDIDSSLLTETTKATITEQLKEIVPKNRSAISNTFNLSPASDPDPLYEDDLVLGASASPTEMEPMHGSRSAHGFSDAQSSLSSATGNRNKYDVITELDNMYDTHQKTGKTIMDRFYERKYPLHTAPSTTTTTTTKSYVGLVNQAMTCYLNSLLQALYMTPEFRNALYRWEFDQDNEAKNIPYQLQKLFLNLQTSPKSSVETTDLTRSFGWDSTEAWQQHDVQELCRVMFDALEHKSKNTKQANFISNLYEGKMLDYVKCLECNTEKTREDTFLDIPLPVRPFGSTVAYGSIEEALRAFVQPETLDGNNQYFCDNCQKKCDAHKGLKFKTFPYVLTLHLKRFDFDYQTMHRIKLNDRVTFPQSLNLNSFLNSSDTDALHYLQSANGSSVTNGNVSGATNVDDCSTADSGSAMEEDNLSSGVVTTASSSQHENDINDEDEGIDMSSNTDHRNSPNKIAAVERLKQESGPYLYELFAIMIHSGSASGGHYYAYIKDFENNEWFCFNDQSVTPITQEDIQKTFGGSSHTAYYSSVYSSSTNAYMLMYRQVDTKRNESAINVNDFPVHIQTLLPKLHAEEESKSTRLGRHNTVTDLALPDLHKPRVYFYNPSMKKLKFTRIYVSQSFDVNHILESAHEMLDVGTFAPLERCRLVAFDSTAEEVIQSLENISDPSLKELRVSQNYSLDFLLEYRAEGQVLEVYEPNGTTWEVYMVDATSLEMDGPFIVHSASSENSDVLRHSIAVRLHIKEDEFLLATIKCFSNEKAAFVAYDPQPTPDAQEHLQTLVNAHFKSLTYVYLNVPNTDACNLEVMGIPSYETQIQPPAVEIHGSDVVDAMLISAATTNTTNSSAGPHALIGDTLDNYHQSSYSRESPLPPPLVTPSHESNSEDSSLSDGDRTLVESMQHRGGGDSQVSSTSHSPQLSSPEDEAASHDSYMRVQALYNGYGDSASSEHRTTPSSNASHFFHANKLECMDVSVSQSCTLIEDDAAGRKPTHGYKILVDSNMPIGAFKRHIEQLIHVRGNYFKLQRKNEVISNNPIDSLNFLNDGDTLTIELGKILQSDEYKAKIYFMRLSDLDNDTGKLSCICEWVYNAATTTECAKKELVAKLHRIDPSYKTLTLENCRIWLKGGRTPIKIFESDELLHTDVRTSMASEFLVQECDEGIKPQVPLDSLTIFLRRWHPDKLQFGKFQELTLGKNSEIRNAISKITDIEEEKIAYTKINRPFPGTNISLLSVNSSMSWSNQSATMDKYPLTSTLNGNMYFYKDITLVPKELSPEERSELSAKEKARLDRLFSITSASSYSPRRERGLKIHLDSPQKPDEVDSSTTRKD